MEIQPPDTLPDEAVGVWEELARDLVIVRNGAPTVADRELLHNVVSAIHRLRQVSTALDDDGPTTAGSTGQLVPHPLIAIEAQLRKDVEAGLFDLGLAMAGRVAMPLAGRLTSVVSLAICCSPSNGQRKKESSAQSSSAPSPNLSRWSAPQDLARLAAIVPPCVACH